MEGFSKTQILQLFACGKCGECMVSCPIYEVTHDRGLSPAARIRTLKSLAKAKYGLKSLLFGSQKVDSTKLKTLVDPLYRGCTICGRCMTVCPFQFDLIHLWEKGRQNVVEQGLAPSSVLQIEDAILAEKNVYKMPHSSRKDWLDYEGVAVQKKEKVDTIYFVGCTTSYSGLLMSIAHAVSSILDASGEDWMLLDDEWCCGSPLAFAGTVEKNREFALNNVKNIEASGAKQVVVNCPSCYRRFTEDYPRLIGRPLKFHVKHIVQLIDEYIKNGRLNQFQKLEDTVTYHDPCELARLSGIYREPRRILAQVATKFKELPENTINTRCCGAGGVLKAVDADLSVNLAKKRIEQAEALGATILTSACPACKLNLDDAAMTADSNIQVLDIAEVVAQQLGLL